MLVQIAYTVLTVIMILIILAGYYKVLQKSNTPPSDSRRKVTYLLLGILAWLTYLYFVSQNNFLYNLSFPPRFQLFVFLPTLLCILFVPYMNRNSAWLAALPKSWPIYYQTFRILVELIIFGTYLLTTSCILSSICSFYAFPIHCSVVES